ncbi:MAG: protease modulator HflC [Phenylobacterium sp.]|uniref:protease modulator HflC n=1 Tax=Phenylobacterium sp. TaxID=1871053 RepID=UPI0025D41C23|nr:protease modulator HflC [Phenylobacterium sp.]MBI1199402.1 protease modulator HflC [Phenylobacterium sp.]
MNARLVAWIVGVVVVAVLALNTLFIVDQREEAIIVAFGDPQYVINPPGKNEAGLHAKIPFMQQVLKLDRRNIALEIAQEEIIGARQERLLVDGFIRYRISDPLQFYTTLRSPQLAEDRIERLVSSSLRQVLGTATQSDIISGRRAELMQQAQATVSQRAKESRMGIQVIDLRIRRVDLPAFNRESVFRRMATSRQQEAARIRAIGEQAKRQKIAEADKEVTVTLATAREQAGQTMGEGDAQRTRIFAQSFGKDPSFAAFYRSMQAYEGSFADGETTLVLSPDSAFFKYFERGPAAR